MDTVQYAGARPWAEPEILEEFRQWLRQLPADVRDKIARGNGDRLFPQQ